MSNPFSSLHVVQGMTEDFIPVNEVYLLGPQCCGGEMKVIALVDIEAGRDADGEGTVLPAPVREFLKWCEEQSVQPAKPRVFRCSRRDGERRIP